jgi:hypothetical protein
MMKEDFKENKTSNILEEEQTEGQKDSEKTAGRLQKDIIPPTQVQPTVHPYKDRNMVKTQFSKEKLKQQQYDVGTKIRNNIKS